MYITDFHPHIISIDTSGNGVRTNVIYTERGDIV